MAQLELKDFIDINTGLFISATSWQVSLDSNFTQIIDESLADEINIYEWNTKLPKIDESGFYADLDNLYARVKVHIGETVSEWFVMEPKSQNQQTIVVNDTDGSTTVYENNEINMQ